MNPPDLLVLSIAIGIVVSFVFSEVYGLAAGGVVVPGYIALYAHKPVAITLTLLIAFGTYALVKVLSSFIIVYGRRRTSLMILVGFSAGAWVSHLEILSGLPRMDDVETNVIGYIIPGLIAIWFDRQGIAPTAASLAIATAVVRLCLLFIAGPLALRGAVL